MPKTLKELTKLAAKTIVSYNKTGVKPWGYETATLDLSCQMGALSKLVMQLNGKRFVKGMSKAQIKERISDELADIICDTLFIAHDLDIDLEKAFAAMLQSDKKKVAERSVKK